MIYLIVIVMEFEAATIQSLMKQYLMWLFRDKTQHKIKINKNNNTVSVSSFQVSLRSVADQVVYTDVAQPQTLGGSVKLASVEVAGNVDVVLINGVDLRHLNANTVKVIGNFTLQGDGCTL